MKSMMNPLRVSPFVSFLVDQRDPRLVRYGIFHRLTGDAFATSEPLQATLANLKRHRVALTEQDLRDADVLRPLLVYLRDRQFLIEAGQSNPLRAFVDHYVVRPRRNPALSFRCGEVIRAVRLKRADRCQIVRDDNPPQIVEEDLPLAVAELFRLADGTRKLGELLTSDGRLPQDVQLGWREISSAVRFLTSPRRQMIRLAPTDFDLDDLLAPYNVLNQSFEPPKHALSASAGTARSFYASRHNQLDSVFDWLETTVSHSFRFPSAAMGGLSYGARFLESVLRRSPIPVNCVQGHLKVLEIGGGLGSFARSFLCQARKTADFPTIDYHILDVSFALRQRQQETLQAAGFTVEHFDGDAQNLAIPGRTFDVIIANEVISDFAVVTATPESVRDAVLPGSRAVCDSAAAALQRIRRYGLSLEHSPPVFFLNVGTFDFLERLWHHLVPGGVAFLVEYGSSTEFPTFLEHLGHPEYSIHFGHTDACARSIGFTTELITLKTFLQVADETSMLCGQQEHIHCLNYLLRRHGAQLPYAAHTRQHVHASVGAILEKADLSGLSFTGLRHAQHFGPDLDQFKVFVLSRPTVE